MYEKAGALSLLLAIAFSDASLADVSVLPRGSGALIVVSGEITSSDAEAFERVSERYSQAAVLFESPGGDLLAGLAIGEIIHKKGYGTGVAPGTRCASACALAWLGGKNRFMSRQSWVGFHAAYWSSDMAVSGPGNALVGAYANTLGLSKDAIRFITSAQPNDMRWLTPQMAKGLGISVTVMETHSDGPPGSAGPKGGRFYVTGLDPNGDNWLALKEGPDIRSRRLDKLQNGAVMSVLSKKGRWFEVVLDDGRRGWVASEYVGCCK